MSDDRPQHPGADYGFDLRSVSWGYRRIFADAIERLLAEGAIGPERREVTRTFFDMLKRSRPGSFDFALKEFLAALNPRTKWMLELPGMFQDFCTLGRDLAAQKLAHGIAFFRTWGAGGFGQTPEQVAALMTHARGLNALDPDLAQAFLAGYERLLDHLDLGQVRLFVGYLRDVYRANPRTAIDSAALRLKSAMVFVRGLTQEARLSDQAARLERLARAVSGRGLTVGDVSSLDSDTLIERGSSVVCAGGRLYLPSKIRCRPSRAENEQLYLLATVASAEAVRAGSFPAIHGSAGAGDIGDWLGAGPRQAALLTIVEVVRVVERLRRRMPGVARLVDFGIALEFATAPARSATDRLLQLCLAGDESASRDTGVPPVRPPATAETAVSLAADIRAAARRSGSLDESVDVVAPLVDRFAGVADVPPRALSFFPDFYFPAGPSAAPAGTVVADLTKRKRARPEDAPDEPKAAEDEPARAAPEAEAAEAAAAAFVYPEWNHAENDYYEDWCFLRERVSRPDERLHPLTDPDIERAARRARRMFERLKPDLARKEKHLAFGDEINTDLLVEYLAMKRRRPAPKVRFYEKTFIRKRDLAVALLLDVSGSTAGAGEGAAGGGSTRIIDLEKRAAMTLGEGLDTLGDAFAIYGFSGNGREHCDFFIYKDLDEQFSPQCRRRLMAAHPVASTRIGVALRHCRTKLAQAPARKKLIILITDGRPQDSGYDPATRYAQYDVRMACQECLRRDIHVVCISTLENSRADLEIMFPHRSYVVLEDMTRLADVLPALYVKMTA